GFPRFNVFASANVRNEQHENVRVHGSERISRQLFSNSIAQGQSGGSLSDSFFAGFHNGPRHARHHSSCRVQGICSADQHEQHWLESWLSYSKYVSAQHDLRCQRRVFKEHGQTYVESGRGVPLSTGERTQLRQPEWAIRV